MGVGGVSSQGQNSPREGGDRGTAAMRDALVAGKAVCMSGFQGRALGLLASAGVSGRSVAAMPGRNQR